MAGDNLFAIIGMLRAEMPEISDDTWDRIKRGLSNAAGGTRPYVPAHPKRSHLEALADINEAATAQQISKMLGVSVSRAYQLKRLRK
ncbi:MAG: hypothetical protein Q8N17_17855 [Burkholderiaceae bacterium]|nr:hypothetical protein [Burkholderiaceae bacterium]